MVGSAVRWREYIESSGETLAEFQIGGAALTEKENILYLARWPDTDLLGSIMRLAAGKAGLETMPLPDDVRIRRRGELTFAFNYGPDEWTLPGTDCVRRTRAEATGTCGVAGGPPSIDWRSRLQSVGAGHSLTWRTIRNQRKDRRSRRGNLNGMFTRD